MPPSSSKPPLRRSQRGRNYAPGYIPGLTHAPKGKPILTRPLRADLDCFAITDSEEEEDAPSSQYTSFFKSFTRQKSNVWNTSRTLGVKGKVKATDPATFSVGDTVLVRSRASTKPTVAVIISIWETHAERRKENTILENDDQDNLKVRVHTFLTPSQLPTVRAAREYRQVILITIWLVSKR
jgi:origin recognition complex subunit 1